VTTASSVPVAAESSVCHVKLTYTPTHTPTRPRAHAHNSLKHARTTHSDTHTHLLVRALVQRVQSSQDERAPSSSNCGINDGALELAEGLAHLRHLSFQRSPEALELDLALHNAREVLLPHESESSSTQRESQ
jgi:hypothetical protein